MVNVMNFEFGGVLISVIIIVFVTFVLSSILNIVLKHYFEKGHLLIKNPRLKRRLEQQLKEEKTRFLIFRRILVAASYIIGFAIALFQIPQLRTLSYSLFAGAGILAAILGFGMQKAFGNMMSGVFIAVFEPFKIGDRISINNENGIVENITLWYIVIRTLDIRKIVIPNSIASDSILINYSKWDEKIVNPINVTITYNSDIDKARKIMLEEARKHPNCLIWKEEVAGIMQIKEPVVRVVNLGSLGVDLRLLVWSEDYQKGLVMTFDLFESIKKGFDKEKIEFAKSTRIMQLS